MKSKVTAKGVAIGALAAFYGLVLWRQRENLTGKLKTQGVVPAAREAFSTVAMGTVALLSDPVATVKQVLLEDAR